MCNQSIQEIKTKNKRGLSNFSDFEDFIATKKKNEGAQNSPVQ